MPTPTPLKTILTPDRYPFAVAKVENGKIVSTVSYATSLEDAHRSTQKWNNSLRGFNFNHKFVMAEMKDLDNTPSYSYWVAI